MQAWAPLGGSTGGHLQRRRGPESPRTQHLRIILVSKAITGMALESRVLKCWVLGPSGKQELESRFRSGDFGMKLWARPSLNKYVDPRLVDFWNSAESISIPILGKQTLKPRLGLFLSLLFGLRNGRCSPYIGSN